MDTNNGLNSFPDDNIDPKQKLGKDFCLMFARAINEEYYNNRSYLNRNSKGVIEGLRAYGNGRQDVRRYVTQLLGVDEDKARGVSTEDLLRKGYMNMNLEVVSVAPKFKTLILQLFEEIEHDVFANAVDEQSINTKEAAMFNLWAKKQLQSELAELNAIIGVQEEQEQYLPESLDELNMMAESGYFKLSTEQAIETSIKYTLEISRWKEIKRRLIEDLFEQNLACAKTYYDPVYKKYKNKYVDIANLVLSHATGNDMEDLHYVGEYRMVSIKTIKTYMDAEGIKEDDYEKLARKNFNLYGNSIGGEEFSTYQAFNQASNSFGYDSFNVLVLDCEYLSTDSEYIQKKKNRFGREIYSEAEHGKVRNNNNRQTIINSIEMWYKCSWVVGSDMIYSYGKANDIVRTNEVKAESSYKIYRIPGKSKLELIVPRLDTIQMAYMKLQNAMAKAKPAGLAIDVSSISNVTRGKTTLDPLEVIKIYNQTGDMLYKASAQRSFTPNHNSGKPISELAGGIGPQLNEFMLIIDTQLNAIREDTGIQPPLDASQPTTGQGLGVTEIAYTSATKALGFTYTAYIDIKERVANDTWGKIANKISVSKETYDVYEKNIGITTTRLLKIDKKIIGDAKANIYIKAKASKEQAARIIAAATESMKASKNGYGGISSSDLIMIERILDGGNIKLAEMVLAKKERDAERRRIEEANMREKSNQESAQILQAQKNREAMEQSKMEETKELAIIEAKVKADLLLEDRKHQNKMKELNLTLEMQNDAILMKSVIDAKNKTQTKTK